MRYAMAISASCVLASCGVKGPPRPPTASRPTETSASSRESTSSGTEPERASSTADRPAGTQTAPVAAPCPDSPSGSCPR
jgi:hypothetical protein